MHSQRPHQPTIPTSSPHPSAYHRRNRPQSYHPGISPHSYHTHSSLTNSQTSHSNRSHHYLSSTLSLNQPQQPLSPSEGSIRRKRRTSLPPNLDTVSELFVATDFGPEYIQKLEEPHTPGIKSPSSKSTNGIKSFSRLSLSGLLSTKPDRPDKTEPDKPQLGKHDSPDFGHGTTSEKRDGSIAGPKDPKDPHTNLPTRSPTVQFPNLPNDSTSALPVDNAHQSPGVPNRSFRKLGLDIAKKSLTVFRPATNSPAKVTDPAAPPLPPDRMTPQSPTVDDTGSTAPPQLTRSKSARSHTTTASAQGKRRTSAHPTRTSESKRPSTNSKSPNPVHSNRHRPPTSVKSVPIFNDKPKNKEDRKEDRKEVSKEVRKEEKQEEKKGEERSRGFWGAVQFPQYTGSAAAQRWQSSGSLPGLLPAFSLADFWASAGPEEAPTKSDPPTPKGKQRVHSIRFSTSAKEGHFVVGTLSTESVLELHKQGVTMDQFQFNHDNTSVNSLVLPGSKYITVSEAHDPAEEPLPVEQPDFSATPVDPLARRRNSTATIGNVGTCPSQTTFEKLIKPKYAPQINVFEVNGVRDDGSSHKMPSVSNTGTKELEKRVPPVLPITNPVMLRKLARQQAVREWVEQTSRSSMLHRTSIHDDMVSLGIPCREDDHSERSSSPVPSDITECSLHRNLRLAPRPTFPPSPDLSPQREDLDTLFDARFIEPPPYIQGLTCEPPVSKPKTPKRPPLHREEGYTFRRIMPGEPLTDSPRESLASGSSGRTQRNVTDMVKRASGYLFIPDHDDDASTAGVLAVPFGRPGIAPPPPSLEGSESLIRWDDSTQASEVGSLSGGEQSAGSIVLATPSTDRGDWFPSHEVRFG